MRCWLAAWMLLLGVLPSPPLLADAAAEARISLFTRQLLLQPDEPTLLMKRALAYSDNAQPELALADLDRASAQAEIPQALYVRGVLAYREGDMEKAYSYFDRFLAVEKNHRAALDYRARLARDLDKPDVALSDYLRLIETDPNQSPGTYIATARLISELEPGAIEQALALLDERMASIGPISSLQRYAVSLELRRKEYDAALQRMAALDPALRATPEWQVDVAEIYLQAGRAREAGDFLQVASEQLVERRPTAARQRLLVKIESLQAQVAGSGLYP